VRKNSFSPSGVFEKPNPQIGQPLRISGGVRARQSTMSKVPNPLGLLSQSPHESTGSLLGRKKDEPKTAKTRIRSLESSKKRLISIDSFTSKAISPILRALSAMKPEQIEDTRVSSPGEIKTVVFQALEQIMPEKSASPHLSHVDKSADFTRH
jgi:hypothetical protein